MSHALPLKMLLELAHTKVDDATKRLGELLASEHACEEKLAMLQEYRTEYHRRLMEAAGEGIDPHAWRNYSRFLTKLDEAIMQQQKIVNHSKQMTAMGQQNWLGERNRLKAFDTLSQREEKKQLQKLNKQEQRMSDEHAAKRFHSRSDSDE